jgi:hypothetical protein
MANRREHTMQRKTFLFLSRIFLLVSLLFSLVSTPHQADAATPLDPQSRQPTPERDSAVSVAPSFPEPALFQPGQPYDPALAQEAIAVAKNSLETLPQEEPAGLAWQPKVFGKRPTYAPQRSCYGLR